MNAVVCERQHNDLFSYAACRKVQTAVNLHIGLLLLRARGSPAARTKTEQQQQRVDDNGRPAALTRCRLLRCVYRKISRKMFPKCQPAALDPHESPRESPSSKCALFLFSFFLLPVTVAHIKSHVNSSRECQRVPGLIIPSPLSEDQRELYNHRE